MALVYSVTEMFIWFWNILCIGSSVWSYRILNHTRLKALPNGYGINGSIYLDPLHGPIELVTTVQRRHRRDSGLHCVFESYCTRASISHATSNDAGIGRP